MQIAYHIGAHCTNEERLFKSVLANVDMFLQNGISVPGPGKYRALLRSTIQELAGAAPPIGTREALLNEIVESDDVQRIILSNSSFICVPNRIVEHGVFYPQAESKTRALRQLFPQDDLTLFFTLRHPASFLQEALTLTKSQNLSEMLGMMHPLEISWADVVRRIKAAAIDAEVIVWCHEDAPLLWPRIIREMADLPADTPIMHAAEGLRGLIRRHAIAQLNDLRTKNPAISDTEFQNAIADLWEKFAIPESDDQEIHISELDVATIEQLGQKYESDLSEIANMEGVTLMMPFE